MSRSKKRSTQVTTPTKPPSVWGWAWQKTPRWLRPWALFLALVLLILAFMLPVIKGTKDLVQDISNPTPTSSAKWSDPIAIHIAREYKTITGCQHGAFLLPTWRVSEITSAIPDERYRKLVDYGLPVAPVALAFDLIHQQASELDRVVLTSLELRIEEYQPLTEPTALVLDIRTCASQMLPSLRLGYLQIDPDQKSYDVLHPRTTSPLTTGIDASLSAYGGPYGLGVDVNSLKPGVYMLSLSGEYVFKNQEYGLDPLLFSMVVPDYQRVQYIYHLEIEGHLVGPDDPAEVVNEFLTTTQRIYLELEFSKHGETAEGLQGQYTYVVNMGTDIDLTGWTLAIRSKNVYYQFPQFVLKAGSGVRVWEGRGIDTPRDLYGALDVLEDIDDSSYVIQIQDPDGNFYSQAWID